MNILNTLPKENKIPLEKLKDMVFHHQEFKIQICFIQNQIHSEINEKIKVVQQVKELEIEVQSL
jgi:hypothetical protein